ncbi:MAG: type II toxin-antitoxin system RelE/ParE family toxin [Treponema sp.]|nr:type II toxin-antitoxin system RelE/ParE family toxin [Candidatus Treponema scatequi]
MNAEAQLSRIQEEIRKLDTLPNAFKLYPKEPWKTNGLRYFPVDNYLIFYMVDENNQVVNVLRVMYGKMDLSNIWK